MFRRRRFIQSAVYGSASAAGPFVGPGDAVTGATHWWGLRGYNAAYATGSNPGVDLLDQAGANAITINIKSDGTLDVAAVATWVAAHTVTTIKVTKLYDQIGTSHMVQATLASMPNLALGPVTGLTSTRPALVFSGAQKLLSAGTTTVAQPVTYNAVAFNNGSTVGGILADPVPNDAELIFGNTANNVLIYAGTTGVTVSATDSTWHSISGAFNGASSAMSVDGSAQTTGQSGSNGISSQLQIGLDSFGSAVLTGNVNEAGVWPSALSGANMISLSSNQHSYWGF